MEIVKENTTPVIQSRLSKFAPWALSLSLLLLFMSEKFEGSVVATANVDASTSNPETYKNELGTLTTTVKTLQLDNKQMQDIIIKKDAELATLAAAFARVQSVAKFGSVTQLPDIVTKFTETIPMQPCDSVKPFEKTGSIAEKWYRYDYRITPDSLQLKNFTIPTETTVLTGIKRKWLLGKQTVTTDITNTNPYITVHQITAAEVVLHEPWYKKWYIWFATGLAGGLLLK